MDSILSIITSRRISPSAVRPLLGGKSRFSVGFSQTSLILSTGQRGSGGEAGSAGTTSTIYCTVFFAIRQCAPPTGLPPGRDFFLCRMVSHLKGNVNLRESRVEPGKCCHCPLSTYPNSLPPRGRWRGCAGRSRYPSEAGYRKDVLCWTIEYLFRCPYGSDQGFPLDGTKFHLDGPGPSRALDPLPEKCGFELARNAGQCRTAGKHFSSYRLR